MFLLQGQIISSKKDNSKNEVIRFEQLNIDLGNLNTTTIKKPKLQETSTLKLVNCVFLKRRDNDFCKDDSDSEIISTLNRRLVLPFYIPVISLICSILIIRSKKIYFSKICIFIYSFSLLVFTELVVRYTGINNITRLLFISLPIILLILFYAFLINKFSKEFKLI